MTGLVGIIANDSARYSLFASCVTKLHLPSGAKVEWLIGGDWCRARNDLAQMTLDSDAKWLWFMDDDHAFHPGILNRLLLANVPLVTPMCLTRTFPFNSVSYTRLSQFDEGGRYIPVPLSDQPTDGLVELEAGGCAGMLIRREVLEAVEPPWFEYADRSEDVIFCEKAKAAGYRLYGDLGARLGHITTAVVWPAVKEGEWVTGFTIGRDLNLYAPAAEKLLQEEVEV